MFSQFKLNNAGYLLTWGPIDPMVYDAVFIFYATWVYLRFVILYLVGFVILSLVEDQLNLGSQVIWKSCLLCVLSNK